MANSQHLSSGEKPVLLHSQRYGWWMVQNKSGKVCSGEHNDPHEAAKEFWKKAKKLKVG